MAKLVFSIRSASSSQIRMLSEHCLNRRADGYSAIDLGRSHLNQQIYGEGSASNSLDSWFKRSLVKKPAKQAEKPFFTIVLSASKELFGGGVPVDVFRDKCLAWLKAEFGDDLVFAELHLDETTPHVHAVVAPTYLKKKRRPGKKKKSETEVEFEARRARAASDVGVRTVGRSSSKWAYQDSYEDLRKNATAALSDLGIVYGDVRRVGVKGRATRDWIKSMGVKLAKRVSVFKIRWAELLKRESLVEHRSDELREGFAILSYEREKLNQEAAAAYDLQKETKLIQSQLMSLVRNLEQSLPLGRSKDARHKWAGDVLAQIRATLNDAEVFSASRDRTIGSPSSTRHSGTERMNDAMSFGSSKKLKF